MFKILFVSTGISNQKTRGKKQRKEMAQPDPHFLFLNLYRWFERKWSVVASSGPMRLVQFLSMVPGVVASVVSDYVRLLIELDVVPVCVGF